MTDKKVGRPTILPEMSEEPLYSEIIDKIESGCNDREIYTALHVSAKTFRIWRDAHRKAYDEAKAVARSNMLELAESALASKMTVRTLKETETIYNSDGTVDKIKVKEKELDKDSLVAMFIAKAGNPEVWNPSEYRRLQLEEKQGNDLKDVIKDVSTYDVKQYSLPENIEVPEGFE